MDRNEFKKILKPLIKQTIKEVLFEEGVLSNIVSEVVTGMGAKRVVAEVAPTKASNGPTQEEISRREEEAEAARQLRIKKLNEAAKINVFEGTTPVPETAAPSPLQGMSSNDSGVDISGILNLANGKWKKLI
jgi:hypothetical protein